MIQIEISLPGKTFLCGEYLALTGGPAIVVSTEPRFRLIATQKNSVSQPGESSEFVNLFEIIHPESPAGRYLKSNLVFWKTVEENWSIKFCDPYRVGGFGASSAQFGLLYCLESSIKKINFYLSSSLSSVDGSVLSFSSAAAKSIAQEIKISISKMIEVYRLFSEFKGKTPSGLDLWGPSLGQIAIMDRNLGEGIIQSWPFLKSQFGFALVHTGKKLSTHQHLADVQPPQNQRESDMALMRALSDDLNEAHFTSFLRNIRKWRQCLIERGLCADHSLELVHQLEASQKVLFAKGCGAMGADVLFVVFENEKRKDIFELLKQMNLAVIATESSLTKGLEIKINDSEVRI